MDAELRFHMQAYAEDLVRSGVAREEAERRARVEFGSVQPLKEECREARGLRWVDETLQDLRYAVRMLRKSPGFAAVAVITLALGIGANTSIFSVVDRFILRPLPFPGPDRLVTILSADKKRGWMGGVAAADLQDWRASSRGFLNICGWLNPIFTLEQRDEPEQMIGGRVNFDFFGMLGVAPRIGRDFLAEDDRPGARRVTLLSAELWHSHFGSDPGVVGKTIRVDGNSAIVIGVLPEGFHFALAGPAQLWMPLALDEQTLKNRRYRFLAVVGRVQPGLSVAAGARLLDTTARRLAQSYPETNANRGIALRTLRDEVGQASNDRALVLFALVVCVLLIACGNVANLVVGRAVSRQKEMAIRIAMGAGRARVLRQLLTENLVLFVAAAGLSVGIAVWGVNWIAESIPFRLRAYLPAGGQLKVDLPVLLYTLGIGILTGVLFGFFPAFHCRRLDVNDALKESTSRVSTGASGARLKSVLIVLEVALSMVVLIASGLLIKGLLRMYESDPGFAPAGIMTAGVLLPESKYSDLKRADAFYTDVLQQIRRLPGVRSAGAASIVPYSGNNSDTYYAIDGRPTPPSGELPFMEITIATPDYFRAMGIRTLRGRVFSEQDTASAPAVMVINQTMARRNWPGEDPVGRRVRYGVALGRIATVVGVVNDTAGITEMDIPLPQAFIPDRQNPARNLTLVVRSDTGLLIPPSALRRAVRAVDNGQPLWEIRPMEDLMAEQQAPFRIVAQVTMFFSALSLFLAALGIYGVVAYSVSARGQEFGIRMALGAARRNLMSLVLGQGLKLAITGLLIGLLAAFAVTRLMRSILYQVSPTDAATFVSISALLLMVTLLASYLPARRASKVDPTRALHYE